MAPCQINEGAGKLNLCSLLRIQYPERLFGGTHKIKGASLLLGGVDKLTMRSLVQTKFQEGVFMLISTINKGAGEL